MAYPRECHTGRGLQAEKWNGRPEWTRTIDLFRVKVGLTHTSNDFDVRGETANAL